MYFGMQIGWFNKHIKRKFLSLYPCRFFYLSSFIVLLIFVVVCFLNNHVIVCFFSQAQSKGFYIPSSPSDSLDSGTCDFHFEADGDDDGFIDDLVEEQSKQVHHPD